MFTPLLTLKALGRAEVAINSVLVHLTALLQLLALIAETKPEDAGDT